MKAHCDEVLSTFPRQRGGFSRDQVRRITEYANSNLLDDMRVERLVYVAGLSTSHFGRVFKVSFGVTPHQWVIKLRIQLAKRLLIEGKLSISHAAHRAGFANQSHFTRTFRRITGATPASWLRESSDKCGVAPPWNGRASDECRRTR